MRFAYSSMGFLLAFIILGAGCGQATTPSVNSAPRSATPTGQDLGSSNNGASVAVYSLDEVKAHDKQGDCWMVIDGKVYDVSNYLNHPGGQAILDGCGKEATALFDGVPHSDRARSYLPNYEIGTLSP